MAAKYKNKILLLSLFVGMVTLACNRTSKDPPVVASPDCEADTCATVNDTCSNGYILMIPSVPGKDLVCSDGREWDEPFCRKDSNSIKCEHKSDNDDRLDDNDNDNGEISDKEKSARDLKLPNFFGRTDYMMRKKFYERVSRHDGFYIISSKEVLYSVHDEAYKVIEGMLGEAPDTFEALKKHNVHLAIASENEGITDLPDYADLPMPQDCGDFCDKTAKEYWNWRSRGFGPAAPGDPVSVGEENVLVTKDDRYFGESILIHEFAHGIHMALAKDEVDFDKKIKSLYEQAKSKGLWSNTYAMENHSEYFAEAVQSYFDSNQSPNFNHNNVRNRSALKKHDPAVFEFIDDIFGKTSWRWEKEQ